MQYMATRFAATLRRQLWREHLGCVAKPHVRATKWRADLCGAHLLLFLCSLITPQFCPLSGNEYVTTAMLPVGTPQDDVTQSDEDRLVMVRRLSNANFLLC